MTIVVVAEKPSVARDIARVLGVRKKAQGFLEGNGYVVTWALGHLVHFAEPDDYGPQWNGRGSCDRHASRLAGASPAMALGRREHVGEGKGARRNSPCTLRKRKMARPLPDGSQ